MQQFFGVTPATDLVYSNGEGWAVEQIEAITHTGTHVDAPYHYGAQSAGRPARTIDEVPLEWCFAPGVVLDMRHKAAGEFITVDDLSQALDRIGYILQPLDIVLSCRRGPIRRLGSAAYFRQPGLGREGVLWLTERGVKVIGIDAYTLDRPFAAMVADYRRTGDGKYIWLAHFAGLTQGILRQIEKLANPRPNRPPPRLFRLMLAGENQSGRAAGWCVARAVGGFACRATPPRAGWDQLANLRAQVHRFW